MLYYYNTGVVEHEVFVHYNEHSMVVDVGFDSMPSIHT